MRLTRRFITQSLDDISLSKPIRYERYYINDGLRVQKKGEFYEKEVLDEKNIILKKTIITKEEFFEIKKTSYSKIIRDSFLYLNDNRVSIKKYYGTYEGLIRIEVEFLSGQEMNNYKKEKWMGNEITKSPLAFDKYLSKLNRKEFILELNKNTK